MRCTLGTWTKSNNALVVLVGGPLSALPVDSMVLLRPNTRIYTLACEHEWTEYDKWQLSSFSFRMREFECTWIWNGISIQLNPGKVESQNSILLARILYKQLATICLENTNPRVKFARWFDVFGSSSSKLLGNSWVERQIIHQTPCEMIKPGKGDGIEFRIKREERIFFSFR